MKRRTLLSAGSSSIFTLALGGTALNHLGAGSGFLVSQANAQTPARVTEMTIGDPDAPIQMIEYASFTCPHCATFHADTFKPIKANYVDTGRIRFTFREVYFDRPSLWASMIARSQDSVDFFFGFSDLLFQKQRDWLEDGDPSVIIQELRTLAKAAGLTDTSLDEYLSDATQAQNLYTWYEENSVADQISAAPSFLIDGEKFDNMTYDGFASVLDAKLD